MQPHTPTRNVALVSSRNTLSASTRNVAMALDADALLNSGQVKAHCGNVSDMCIWRWRRDERVGFPTPLQINRRNYWRLGDVLAWQERLSGAQKSGGSVVAQVAA